MFKKVVMMDKDQNIILHIDTTDPDLFDKAIMDDSSIDIRTSHDSIVIQLLKDYDNDKSMSFTV